MQTEKKSYGLLLERANNYGTEYVIARVTSRRGDAPYGCSLDGEQSYSGTPKHLEGTQLDGLCMQGFVSDVNDFAFIGYDPEYHDVYSLHLPKLERMTKTLTLVVARQREDEARELGDVFVSLAAALKLDFAVERVGQRRGSSYADRDWHFMSIAEGRNRYRQLIEEAQHEVRERNERAI
jgi:hypothetical protein